MEKDAADNNEKTPKNTKDASLTVDASLTPRSPSKEQLKRQIDCKGKCSWHTPNHPTLLRKVF